MRRCITVALLATALCGGNSRAAEPIRTATVPTYEPFVIRLNVKPGVRNPFDPAQVHVVAYFKHQSGKAFTVPAFWFRDFRRELVGQGGTGHLVPHGEPEFRVRFSPPLKGSYTYHVVAVVGGLKSAVRRGALVATAARTKGPLRRGRSARYLQNAAGEGVFLIGQNVGWSRKRPAKEKPVPTAGLTAATREARRQRRDEVRMLDLLRYVDEMAATGQNFLRLWLCSWCLGFEHQETGRYDLGRAWQLDRIVRRAEQRGVYLMLCFENFHDIKEKLSPYWRRGAGKPGCITKPEEYFTAAAARNAFKNRLRYAIARWGHSRAVAAWEFFNEMEYVVLGPLELDAAVRDKYFKPWLTEMAAHVRTWDAHGHLLTNSLATDRIWDGMNRMKWLDLAQHHVYLNEWDRDSAGKALDSLSLISGYKKPYLLGEFGGAAAGVYGATKNVVNERDKGGVHLHNAIWAGALSGSCATPLMWWWDEYVRPNKLYYHYAALSKFLRRTPWLDRTLRPEDASTLDVRVRVLRGDTWARVWAQNRSYTWEAGGATERIRPVTPGAIRIAKLRPGRYRVEWWDPIKGCVTRTEERDVKGELVLRIPALKTDVAAKVIPVGRAEPKTPG